MRTRHAAHALPAFPVYSSAFLSKDRLLLGGGGGAGRSGVKNRIRLYKVESDENFELLDELELERDEDAPMSMTVHPERNELVCGINSTTEQLQKGHNENCRVYTVKDNKIILARTSGTFQSNNEEDYQKVSVFSHDYDLLAVGSTNNEVALLSWPTLTPVLALPIQLGNAELYDAAFSPTSLVIATATHLQVFPLPEFGATKGKGRGKGKGKSKLPSALKLIQKVEPPSSPEGMTFRAARFHPTQPETLYTVLNTSPKRTRGSKSAPRRAYICKLDTKTWKVVMMRKIGEKGVTCFDISGDGKLIAFGSSDYTIGILDSQTFAPLLTILKAHDFPPTTLRFNPDASLLMSGSADNSVRVVVVPKSFGNSWTTTILIIITLIILVLAIALQRGVRV